MTDLLHRPLRKHARLDSIFKKMPSAAQNQFGGIAAGDAVAWGRTFNNALLGVILMACAAEQALFLTAIYDDIYPDLDVRDAYISLIKTGHFIDVMDHEDKLHRQRVLIAYSAVMQARGKL